MKSITKHTNFRRLTYIELLILIFKIFRIKNIFQGKRMVC